MNSQESARMAAQYAVEKKGMDVVILDMKNLVSFTDYFVIISANSDTQVKAIADNIEKKLRDKKIKSYHKEGYGSLRWVLLDYIDFVVHIFLRESREFYDLERLYSDAKKHTVTEEGDDS